MAAHGWGEASSLEEWLFAEGRRFDFFQAVALLEALAPGTCPLGEGAEPAAEALRLRATLDLSFPETDIASIKRPRSAAGQPELTVNFMSLAGALGPLPPPYAELAYQRAARGDTALRDFLDIFHHRLLSILYRSRKRHRVGVGVSAPPEDDVARYLYALIGLGLPELQGRLGAVRDRALLHPAGLLAREVRPIAGLEGLLRHHFGVPAEITPLTGAYHPIEPSDQTRIGPSGKNRRLGHDALLGRRAWDQEAAFEIVLGPLSREHYLRVLPIPWPDGDLLAPLCALTRFYAGETMDFTVLLRLRAEEAPPARLGRAHGARLGYTAWLGQGKKEQPLIEKRLRAPVLRRAMAQPPGDTAQPSPAPPAPLRQV